MYLYASYVLVLKISNNLGSLSTNAIGGGKVLKVIIVTCPLSTDSLTIIPNKI